MVKTKGEFSLFITLFFGFELIKFIDWLLQFLLSSSCDKNVRLWHQGQDDCIKVFPHNDYGKRVQVLSKY